MERELWGSTDWYGGFSSLPQECHSLSLIHSVSISERLLREGGLAERLRAQPLSDWETTDSDSASPSLCWHLSSGA